MHISAIVARSENNVIGVNNKLPWHLPADLKHFKQVTMGRPIIMGRKTYESIGRPLPGRKNIVITHDQEYQAPGCLVFNSIEDALEACEDNEEIFLIGGAQLFESMLPRIQTIYLTIVHADISGDVYFPELKKEEWHETQKQTFLPDENNLYSYSFITLLRI